MELAYVQIVARMEMIHLDKADIFHAVHSLFGVFIGRVMDLHVAYLTHLA